MVHRMSRKSTIPTTGRNVQFQVRQMGHTSITNFASSLPKNGLIIDVGAGLSQLGHAITEARDDVTWVNLDPYYHNFTAGVHPKNLVFSSGDIVAFDQAAQKYLAKADLVYSYWLLPHLSLESIKPAKQAVRNMKHLLKSDGRLIIGPVKKPGLGLFSPFRYKGVISYSQAQLTDVVITQIVKATTLWWLPRIVQRLANRYNIHLLRRFIGGARITSSR